MSPCLGTTPGAVNGAEKPGKEGSSRGFRELKEALKILESLKNMTVEQLWTGGSPTSPTSAEPASTTSVASSVTPTVPEKPTKEKRFLDDIKKLQENLRKTLDNVAIVEEEKMEAVVEAGGAGAATEVSSIHLPHCQCSPNECVSGQKCIISVSHVPMCVCSGRASGRGEAPAGPPDPGGRRGVAQRISQ